MLITITDWFTFNCSEEILLLFNLIPNCIKYNSINLTEEHYIIIIKYLN